MLAVSGVDIAIIVGGDLCIQEIAMGVQTRGGGGQ